MDGDVITDSRQPPNIVGKIMLDGLETSPLPMAVMDHRRRIHWYNISAGVIFRESALIYLTDDHLNIATDNGSEAMHAFIRDASTASALSLLTVKSERGDFVLKGRLLAQEHEEKLIGISLQHSRFHTNLAAQHTRFSERFSLTRAETRVTQELSLGFSASEVAANLGISVETVRTHIRRIYTKLEVGSREGMLARVRPYLSW